MLYRGYVECGVETCRSVLICDIIVHLLVIVQNRKKHFTILVHVKIFGGSLKKQPFHPTTH